MKQTDWKNWIILPLLLTSCGGNEQKENNMPVPVRVEVLEVSPTAIVHTGHFTGTIEEKNGTSLSFATAGTVRTMDVSLGDRVSAGQLIGTLDDTSARNAHAAARATLAQAEDAWRRMKELHDKGSLPEIKWVEAESKLQQARSMEALARKQLDDCRLTAPYAGIIAERTGEAGQNVVPGMSVARLVSAAGRQVRIAVPEAEIGGIRPGQQADIDVAALPGKTYRGTVVERGVKADALSRSYEVKLRVDNADDALLPGMVAEVALADNGGETACVLPMHIVQIDEHNRQFVWVDSAGKAEKRAITCGDFTGDGVVVTQGLVPGDRVIVKGQHKVCNGTQLEAIAR